MTQPLDRPPRKSPELRTRVPMRPPEPRSRASMGLTAAAAEGRLALQCCADCGTWQYPPRDACAACLSEDLPFTDLDGAGTLLAETTVRVSSRPYFRERLPWRMGSVQLEAGPVVLAHLHPDVPEAGARVRLTVKLDRAGQGVMLALPQDDTPNMEDAEIMRALTSDPKHRRILISDARAPVALPLSRALLAAGAAEVRAGLAEDWLPFEGRAALEAAGVQIVPLDVTDTASVQRLAAQVGGKVDILVNTAQLVRAGGPLARGDVHVAQREMEVNYFGLMRLAQAFGPGMCGRTADGVNSAVAFVQLLHVGAVANHPDFGAFSASQAAARSLAHALRAEFRGAGLRVMTVIAGPTESEWFEPLPPPKVSPNALARDIVRGLQGGLEDVWSGDIARDIQDRLRRDPKVLERELTMGGEDAP